MEIDLVRTERFFDPVRLVRFVTLHVAHRRRQIQPGVVGIEHQDDIGPDSLRTALIRASSCAGERRPTFILTA